MAKKIISILFLAIALCGDSMLNLMLVWTILEKQGSISSLGFTICLMSIAPYLLQKYVKPLKSLMAKKPLLIFGTVRLLGIAVLLLLVFVLDQESVYTYYIVGGLFACIFFLSMQSLEAYMSQKVIEGKINSNVASANLQAAIQVGALCGNALTGILLAWGGMDLVSFALGLTLMIGVSIPWLLPLMSEQTTESQPAKELQNEISPRLNVTDQITKNRLLSLTVIGVTVLTIQLASINFLMPIIFYEIFQWSSVQYGIVGAVMGLGAFAATIIGKWEKFLPKSIFILICIIDLLIGQLAFLSAAIILGFLLGFVFNRSRIYQRVIMFNFLDSNEETVLWSGRATAAFQFTKALIPLLLVLPLSLLGKENAGVLLAFIGFTVTISLLVVYWYEKKWTALNREEAAYNVETTVTK